MGPDPESEVANCLPQARVRTSFMTITSLACTCQQPTVLNRVKPLQRAVRSKFTLLQKEHGEVSYLQQLLKPQLSGHVQVATPKAVCWRAPITSVLVSVRCVLFYT